MIGWAGEGAPKFSSTAVLFCKTWPDEPPDHPGVPHEVNFRRLDRLAQARVNSWASVPSAQPRTGLD